MNITLNGEPRHVEPATTLRGLVQTQQGVAIAVNGEVVPASSWTSRHLVENDAVEIVTAHQGG